MTDTSTSTQRAEPAVDAEISLLTQHDCRLCEHAKDVLRRVGADYRLRVTEIDLASEVGRTMATQAGVMFAPGVLVNGQLFCFGRLSERKLRRALAARGGHARAGG